MWDKIEKSLLGDRTTILKEALQSFNKTSEDLTQDIGILKTWMKSQPHFPEIPGDDFLKNVVLLNKFSIEKAKNHLEMYYSLRSVLPEIFENKNHRLPHMIVASKAIFYAPLPKLTKEQYRVSVMKIMTTNADHYVPYDVVGHIYKFLEIRMISDVMAGEIFVVDMENITLGHIGKFTPVVLKKCFLAAEKVYKNIVKQIHFLNVAPFVDGFISLVKQIVSKKLSERIYAHQTTESLHKHFPKEILPKEYGGSEISFIELKDQWFSLLDKYESRLDELGNIKTDESKRPTPLVNDDFFGFYGNFKKLNVD